MRVDVPPSPAAARAALVVAACALGTIGTAAALGPDELTGAAAGSWRAVIGGLGLVLVAWALGDPPWRHPPRWGWSLLGGAAVAVNQLAFLEAVTRTGVAVGTLVTLATVPVAAGLVDLVGRGPRPGSAWLQGVAVALAGVALLTGGAGEVAADGVLLAVVAGAAVPGFGLAGQRLMTDRPPVTAMATVLGLGGVALVPVAIVTAGAALATWGSVATVVYLGTVTVAGAYALWGVGLAGLPLSTVASVALLEPAVAAVLAVTVVGEPFTVELAVGVVLVVVGVRLASRPASPSGRVGDG